MSLLALIVLILPSFLYVANQSFDYEGIEIGIA